jgi:hypothetical protein
MGSRTIWFPSVIKDHARTQTASLRLLTTKGQVQLQYGPQKTYSTQSGTGTVMSPSTLYFITQHITLIYQQNPVQYV